MLLDLPGVEFSPTHRVIWRNAIGDYEQRFWIGIYRNLQLFFFLRTLRYGTDHSALHYPQRLGIRPCFADTTVEVWYSTLVG